MTVSRPAITAVALDFDGVVVDSLPGIRHSLDIGLAVVGLAATTDSEIRSVVGPPLADGVRSLLSQRGDPVELCDRIVGEFRLDYATSSLDRSQLYPGVVDLVARLRSDGRQVAIATSKPSAATHALLELFGLRDSFDAIECPRDGTSDTKTTILGRALGALGTSPTTTAMVGDRSHDMIAAVATGCLGIGALWGYGGRDELEGAGATCLADTPADVARLVSA